MMGSGFSSAMGRGLAALFILFVGGAFLLGLLFMWGIPKLWHLIKPIIHQLTA